MTILKTNRVINAHRLNVKIRTFIVGGTYCLRKMFVNSSQIITFSSDIPV